MTATELRIGNWIGIDNSGGAYQIQTINADCCTHTNSITMTDKLTPIPLTEEWGIKFGAKLINTTEEGWKEYEIIGDAPSSTLIIRFGEGFVSVFNRSGCDNTLQFIRQANEVHTFQNVAHSLTGEELTIKENDSNHLETIQEQAN